MGAMIELAAGVRKRNGYLAPAADGGPGVIVLQEWWGLVPHIQDVADRFARAGFTALAPDLYRGESARSPDQAGKLMMALDIAETAKDLGLAIEYLLALPSCTSKKVGTVGFCMGGQLSLFAACAFPERVGVCVDFYGIHPNVKPDLERLAAPLVGFFAERDTAVTLAARALEAELRRLGKAVELKVFPGTDHGFFNDTREVYHAAAAEECWQTMVQRFREHLR